MRFRLQLERGDNPADNAVGGELILKYRYQDVRRHNGQASYFASQWPVDRLRHPRSLVGLRRI